MSTSSVIRLLDETADRGKADVVLVKVLPKDTATVQANADRFAKISRISGTGGNVVLAAATLGLTCYKIGQTKDRQAQNEILAESLGGIAKDSYQYYSPEGAQIDIVKATGVDQIC